MIKKLSAVLLVVLLLASMLSITGCGGNQEVSTNGKDEKIRTFKIATVVKDSSDPWFIRMEEGVKRFASDTGCNSFQKGPSKTDAAQQYRLSKS